MADTQYYLVVTDIGKTLIDEAYNNSTKVNIIEMALGDSSGSYVKPDSSFTQLVSEFGREDIHDDLGGIDGLIHVISKVTAKNAGQTVREFGLYDDLGNMIAYGAYPESLVPEVDSAEFIQLEIEAMVYLDNASAVTISVNPIYQYASEDEAGIIKIIKEPEVLEEDESKADDSKVLTLLKILKRKATETLIGLSRFSTKDEAVAGTSTSTTLSPKTGLDLIKSTISSALDSTSEDYSLSLLGGKTLKDLIDSTNLSLTNLINKKYDKTGGQLNGGMQIKNASSPESGIKLQSSKGEAWIFTGDDGVVIGHVVEGAWKGFLRISESFTHETKSGAYEIFSELRPPKVIELDDRVGWFGNQRKSLKTIELTFNNLDMPAYVQSFTADATSALGYPIEEAGTLDVSVSAGGRKILLYTSFSTKRIFIGSVIQSSPDSLPSDWDEIYSSVNPPTIDDIGLGHIGKAAVGVSVQANDVAGESYQEFYDYATDHFDLVSFDPSKYETHIYESGYYLVDVIVMRSEAVTTAVAGINVTVKVNDIEHMHGFVGKSSATKRNSIQMKDVIRLNEGDRVRVYSDQDATWLDGGSITFQYLRPITTSKSNKAGGMSLITPQTTGYYQAVIAPKLSR
ncbi:phage tail protein [Vibrio harveyi]|uniref:phage tail-collar fiber domain-containing protein n=1 Tax=Vibrio harveyi TaxID=669 RepID=UPI003D730516